MVRAVVAAAAVWGEESGDRDGGDVGEEAGQQQ